MKKSLPQSTLVKLALVFSMAILYAACVGNSTDSSTYSDRYSTSGTSGDSSYPYSVSDIVSHVKSQAPSCSTGTRIDMHASTSSLSSTSTISTISSVVSGGVVAYYIGESYWSDVMIICKTTSGTYNITVSFCPYSSILTSSSSITAFQAPYGITVDTISEGISTITAAKNTYVKIVNSSQTINFGPTTFYSVSTSN